MSETLRQENEEKNDKPEPGDSSTPGLKYIRGVRGKVVYRIRESLVRDFYVPLMKKNAVAAVKLDLALRGITLLPEQAGDRRAGGFVNGYVAYEDMHDMIRSETYYSENAGSAIDYSESKQRKLKREWIREQLDKLEGMKLIRRVLPEGGGRPGIEVLRDTGTGEKFDDPTGRGQDSYLSVVGHVFAHGSMQTWGTPEVSFYLAALIAERHHRHLTKVESEIGCGEWFQPFSWFSDKNKYRRESHVRIDFSAATLDRGLRSLLRAGLVEKELSRKMPGTGKQFRRGLRNIYTNQFRRYPLPSEAR